MDKILLNAIEKYFRTLKSVGYLKEKEVNKLFLVCVIYDLYISSSIYFHKTSDRKAFYERLFCLVSNSCLFPNNAKDSIVLPTTEAIVDIENKISMSTTNSETIVSTEKKTKDFTEFTEKTHSDKGNTQIEDDQYIVGYDKSDNKEIKINVDDMGKSILDSIITIDGNFN